MEKIEIRGTEDKVNLFLNLASEITRCVGKTGDVALERSLMETARRLYDAVVKELSANEEAQQ